MVFSVEAGAEPITVLESKCVGEGPSVLAFAYSCLSLQILHSGSSTDLQGTAGQSTSLD